MADALQDGLLRSARMRPSAWHGPTTRPMVGAFCSTCYGKRWCGVGGGWFCTACHPEAGASGAGEIVVTGGDGHG